MGIETLANQPNTQMALEHTDAESNNTTSDEGVVEAGNSDGTRHTEDARRNDGTRRTERAQDAPARTLRTSHILLADGLPGDVEPESGANPEREMVDGTADAPATAVADDLPGAADAGAATSPAPVVDAAGAVTEGAPAPLARLKGVQRQLAQAQKELTTTRAEADALRVNLSTAQKRAAGEYAERIRATQSDIVPQLIGGETIEQVEKSLADSKAAFSAAQQAYARLLPTPAGRPAPARVGHFAPPDADQGLSPLQLLRAGLSETKNDINR